MPQQQVYRGWSVDEVTAAYYRDAWAATKRGYVPTDEQWADFFGAPILTVKYEHRPNEVAEVRRMILVSGLTVPSVDDILELSPANTRSRSGTLRRHRAVIVLISLSAVVVVTVWLSLLLSGAFS